MKVVKTALLSVAIIVILGVITLAVWFFFFMDQDDEAKEQSIGDMNKFSYETPEVTTDLKNGTFVRIQFTIITDGNKGVTELEDREFQIQNMLIKELANKSEVDFQEKETLSKLENAIKDDLNEVMKDGRVTDVYTINKILQ